MSRGQNILINSALKELEKSKKFYSVHLYKRPLHPYFELEFEGHLKVIKVYLEKFSEFGATQGGGIHARYKKINEHSIARYIMKLIDQEYAHDIFYIYCLPSCPEPSSNVIYVDFKLRKVVGG